MNGSVNRAEYEKVQISPWQLFALLMITRLVPVVIGFPLASVTTQEQDLWISVLLSVPISLAYSLLVVRLCEAFPGKSLIGILLHLLGPVLGRFAGLLLLNSWILILAAMLRAVAEVNVAAVTPETPVVVFLALLAAAAVYAARKGLEPIARGSEIVLIILSGFFLFLLVLPLNLAEPSNLLPLLEHGWETVILGTLNTVSFYTEFAIAGMLLPHLRHRKGGRKPVIGAVFASSALLLVFIVVLIMVFGSLLSSIAFPAFSLARVVSVGEFIERTESLGMVAWVLTHSLKCSLFIWACAVGLAEVFGIPDAKPLMAPLGFLSVALALTFFRDGFELYRFFQVRTGGALNLGLHLVLAFAVLGGLAWKKLTTGK